MNKFHFSLFSITRALDSSNVFTLGLASLSAYLKERGFSVSVKPLWLPLDRNDRKLLNAEPYKHPELFSWIFPADNFVEYPQPFLEAIKKATLLLELWVRGIGKEMPSVIGLSVFNKNLFVNLLFLKLLKGRYPDIPVILGGPACNRSNARFLCATGLADMVVIGEGEETLAALLEQLRNGRLGPTPGAFVRLGGQVIDGGARALLNINTLPVPDFDGLLELQDIKSVLPVAFNRGCNFPCKFCNERKFWLKFRQVEPERAIDLLRDLHERYGVSRFFLSQSLLNGDLRWLKEFAEIMQERVLPYHWGGNIRIHPKMDEAYLRTLYAGGCRVLLFGVESGSDSVLKLMNKGTNAATCRAVLRTASEIGFWIHTYWIFGFPGETENDLLQSVDFLIDNFDSISSYHIHEYNAAIEPDMVNAENMVDYVRQTSIYLSPTSHFFAEHAKVLRMFIRGLNEKVAISATEATGMISRFFECSPSGEEAQRGSILDLLRALKYYLENPAERKALEAHFTREAFDLASNSYRLNESKVKETQRVLRS